MNENRRVVQFTLLATLLLVGAGLYTQFSGTQTLSLQNINLVADVFGPSQTGPATHSGQPAGSAAIDTVVTAPALANGQQSGNKLETYQLPGIITHFGDTAQPSLPQLMHKLADLKRGGKRKIRIAWLGDSMIEGDLLTQTLRKRLQQEFGGKGVGFVCIQSAVAGFRTTVRHSWSGTWKEENFKSDDHTAPLFFSGHVYFGANGTVTLTDATTKDTVQPLIKSLICGPSTGAVTITINGHPQSIHPTQRLNRIVLDSTGTRTITVQVSDANMPVYGITLEPASGITIDNFSFRGISGVELGKVDTALMQSTMQNNPYDLVVLEYGANLMFRPNDTDYGWFEAKMQPVLARLRRAMPGTEFMLVSTADRAFNYGGEWKTAIGIDNLLEMQARVAQHNNAAFYNLYQSEGGYGTIVRWADTTPSLGNKDYIHPNHNGAEILGNLLFDAFMKDYRKAAATPPTAAK